jgi:hypothetical protein
MMNLDQGLCVYSKYHLPARRDATTARALEDLHSASEPDARAAGQRRLRRRLWAALAVACCVAVPAYAGWGTATLASRSTLSRVQYQHRDSAEGRQRGPGAREAAGLGAAGTDAGSSPSVICQPLASQLVDVQGQLAVATSARQHAGVERCYRLYSQTLGDGQLRRYLVTLYLLCCSACW